jgi:hypothetical protein
MDKNENLDEEEDQRCFSVPGLSAIQEIRVVDPDSVTLWIRIQGQES